MGVGGRPTERRVVKDSVACKHKFVACSSNLHRMARRQRFCGAANHREKGEKGFSSGSVSGFVGLVRC